MAARILVIDDEAIIAAELEERLTRMGYEVVALGLTGQEAVNLADSHRPDLVLMDIMMPGKQDGVDAAQRIRREMGIPTVFLTAYGDRGLIDRAKMAMPLGYILKPFQENQLYSTLEIALFNKTIESRIRQSEARYRAVVEDQSDLVCRFRPDRTLSFTNEAFRRFFSETPLGESAVSFTDLFKEADARTLVKAIESLSPDAPIHEIQTCVPWQLSGHYLHLHWILAAIADVNGRILEYQAVGRDISSRVAAEENVRRLNRELEQRVRDRTRNLEIKTQRLEETNVALEVLLKQREIDRQHMEDNIIKNVKELIEPALHQIKYAASESTRTAYLDILETNLNHIISPFSRKLSDYFAGLTGQEIQVANLVKQGKTAKESAEIMGLSTRTIDAYRANIRKKLGLTQRRINLQTYLKSLG
ncbi:MAG: response regulator [Desulfobacterales bacterium]